MTRCHSVTAGNGFIYFAAIADPDALRYGLFGKVSLDGNKEWVKTITSER